MRPIDVAVEEIKKELSGLSDLVSDVLVNLVNKNWSPEYYARRAAEARELKERVRRMVIEAIARFQPAASDLNSLVLFYEASYGLFRFSRYALDLVRAVSTIAAPSCDLRHSWRASQSALTLVNLSIRLLSTYQGSQYIAESAAALSYAEGLERDVDETLSSVLREASERADLCLMLDLLSVVFLERIADHSIYMIRRLAELK